VDEFNEIVLLRSSASARYFAGFPIGFNIVLGGQLPDGADATNYLSYMCLRAQTNLGLYPTQFIDPHPSKQPAEFLLAASSVIGLGSGMPQVFNDEVIIPGQLRHGIKPGGCVQLRRGWAVWNFLRRVKRSAGAMRPCSTWTRVLELTLFRRQGSAQRSTDRLGDGRGWMKWIYLTQLEEAYDRQMARFIRLMVEGCNIVDAVHAQ